MNPKRSSAPLLVLCLILLCALPASRATGEIRGDTRSSLEEGTQGTPVIIVTYEDLEAGSARPAGEARKGDEEAKSAAESDSENVDADIMPQLLEMPRPVYPDEARKQGIEGTVHIKARVGEDGKVQEASVAKSAHPLLDESALAAVRKASFKPAVKDGHAISFWVQIPVKFALDGHGEKKGKEEKEKQ